MLLQHRRSRDPCLHLIEHRLFVKATPKLDVRKVRRRQLDRIEHRQRVFVAIEATDPQHERVAEGGSRLSGLVLVAGTEMGR